MDAAVFLDRDNTLIHNDGDLGEPEKVRLMQGVATAVASLCGLGYKVVVITNQGGVARGKYTEQDVDAVHERVRELITRGANGARIDRFYYCPYHPGGSVEQYKCEHVNRKPQPGMLLEAARDMKLDLGQSWTIGDQMRDVEAGKAAGTRTILLHPTSTPVPLNDKGVKPDFVARTLVEAVRIVAQQRKPESHDPARGGDFGPRRWDAAAVAILQKPKAEEPGDDDKDEAPPEKKTLNPATAEPDAGDASGRSDDAAVADDMAPSDDTASSRASRPFRPWNAPPAEAQNDVAGRFDQRRQRRPERVPPHAEAAVSEPPAPVVEEGISEPPAPIPVREAPAKPPEPTIDAATPDAGDELPPSAASTDTDRTLRLILQELRSQRGLGEEFSYLYVVAIVLQMIAATCLLGALWMGAGDLDLFFRWMGAGLLLQGATIATLLFGR